VRRYIATISHLHRAAELPDPTKAETVRLALRRLARTKGARQRQASGITRSVASSILDVLGDRPKDMRDRALLLVGRDLLARRSELVALDVGHVTFAADGTATVLITRSKTDQDGQGAVRLLGPGATAALRGWIATRGKCQPTDPVFVALSRAGKPLSRLLANDVARIYKAIAARAGVDSAKISGHSCRVGMAQDLVAHGCDLAAIMQAGRWKTAAMPARYSEALQARRGAVATFYGLY
jgi:site-specific recombinase XerD